MKKLLALSGLALATTTASALERPYLGVDVVQANYDLNTGASASPQAAQLRFGSDLSRWFGLEARASVGANGDTITNAGVNYDLTVDSMYTVGATFRIPWGNHGGVYALAGYSYAQFSAQSATPSTNPSTEGNDDGFSWGAGLVLPAWKNYNFEVDYTSYFDGNGYTLDGFSVGVRRYL